jgi:hypothetical protein
LIAGCLGIVLCALSGELTVISIIYSRLAWEKWVVVGLLFTLGIWNLKVWHFTRRGAFIVYDDAWKFQ